MDKTDEIAKDDHWCVWDPVYFANFCQQTAIFFNLEVVEWLPEDDKVGNGMLVLFKIC